MNNNNFYITTPIYYVNSRPHIGHAYTTVIADVLARYHRLSGEDTWFLTGTDEHGTKIQEAADKNGISPLQHCDKIAGEFKELWKKLNITNNDFIRTTEERHKVIVRKIMQDLFDRDLIYKAEYKGWYCVPCERFFTEKDLVNNMCPECGRPVKELVESNYFFRMSRYQDWLVDYIKTHEDFILPSFRANETLGFLKKPLNDLCVSRPKSRLSWGIELPFDKDYVCYVWFDALINYISAIGYFSDEAGFSKWWPASYHLMAKDILTTHSVYWPIMLKAIGIEMPKTIFAHGWWLFGSEKMSKSLGNVVNPMELADKYGVDAFRYFLLSEMVLGQDASFTEEAFIKRYNTDLANDLGNFLNRVTKFIIRQYDGVIPPPSQDTGLETEFKDSVLNAVSAIESSFAEMKLDKGIESVLSAVRAGNRYMEQTAPWKLSKDGNLERLNTVLYTAAEALRIISALLCPIIPVKSEQIRESLGIKNEPVVLTTLKVWGGLKPGQRISDIGVLFPRIEEEKPSEKKAEPQPAAKQAQPVPGVITFDEFFRSSLKTAKVIDAEKVEKTDKLLKLQIEIGEEKRQIVAGIAQYYSPDEIKGRTIVVVSNLKPAKICGIESNGMLLAAKTKDKLKVITVDGDMPSGVPIG